MSASGEGIHICDALGLSPNRLVQGRTESAHAFIKRMCEALARLGCAVARSLSSSLARQCSFLGFLHGMVDEFPHPRVWIDPLAGRALC